MHPIVFPCAPVLESESQPPLQWLNIKDCWLEVGRKRETQRLGLSHHYRLCFKMDGQYLQCLSVRSLYVFVITSGFICNVLFLRYLDPVRRFIVHRNNERMSRLEVNIRLAHLKAIFFCFFFVSLLCPAQYKYSVLYV